MGLLMDIPEGVEIQSVFVRNYDDIDSLVHALPEHFDKITPDILSVKSESVLSKYDFAHLGAGNFAVINGEQKFASCKFIVSEHSNDPPIEVMTSFNNSSFSPDIYFGVDVTKMLRVGADAICDDIWILARYASGRVGLWHQKGLKNMSAQVLCIPL